MNCVINSFYDVAEKISIIQNGTVEYNKKLLQCLSGD